MKTIKKYWWIPTLVLGGLLLLACQISFSLPGSFQEPEKPAGVTSKFEVEIPQFGRGAINCTTEDELEVLIIVVNVVETPGEVVSYPDPIIFHFSRNPQGEVVAFERVEETLFELGTLEEDDIFTFYTEDIFGVESGVILFSYWGDNIEGGMCFVHPDDISQGE